MATIPVPYSRKWIILDLDNCCADDEWRMRYIDWSADDPDERYDVYHKLAPYDVGLVPTGAIEWLQAGAAVAVFTARPARYRDFTERWLKEALRLQPNVLMMRKEGDHRKSEEIKRSMLADLRNPNNQFMVPGDEIVAAYDDHQSVIDMYHSEGVNAVQCRFHDVNAYEPPASAIEPPPLDALAALRQAQVTFAQRNELYKSNYTNYGAVLAGLFPEGLTLRGAEDWNRLALVFNCANKLSRYTQMMSRGGHRDSAQDLIVYAAMLQEVTK